MKKIGYVRVSTKEQNTDRQVEELLKHGVDKRNIYIDKASGKDFNRVAYQFMKMAVNDGEGEYELFIKELDRLGRNKEEIKTELEYFKQNGILVRVLDVPTTLMDYSKFEDMSKSVMDMVNNILLEVYSTLAEQEREKIRSRQAEGIASAKKNGIQFGRPKKEVNQKEFEKVYNIWKLGQITAVMAMKELNLTKATFYRRVKEYESR